MMGGRTFGRGVVALAAAMVLASCNPFAKDETPTCRYRLTVEVGTPEGTKAGSSVIEVDTGHDPGRLGPGTGGVWFKIRGEAVAVDLGDGRTLFALLRSDNDVEWAARAMLLLAPKVEGEPFLEQFDNMVDLEGEIALPRMWPRMGHLDERSAYPMLVSFGDVADPASVRLVDPDDLAASFGEGVSLRRITVQMTDDPVTTGIEKRLGWLSEYPEPRLDPNYRGSTNPNLSQRLWHGDFRKGTN